MPTHWTYDGTWNTADDLEQGDVLLPTDGLSSLFDRVLPHFCDRKYVGFIILTQSCDLVRRKGVCTARYINLAVIRQLDAVLAAFLDTVCDTVREGVYLTESKLDAKKLLARVFNQNEQNLGLFYLHPDVDVGIGKPSVALLRVSVAFRVKHYDVIREARTGRLTPEFRNKLGWLVGNIFSRIGTPDWSEQPDGKETINKLTTRLLQEHALWIVRAAKEAAEEAGIDIQKLPREEIAPTLAKHEPPPPKDEALACVQRVIRDVLSDVPEKVVERVLQRLRNDERFSMVFRRAKRQ